MNKFAKKTAQGAVFVSKPLGEGRVSPDFIEALKKAGASDEVVEAASRKRVRGKGDSAKRVVRRAS